VRAIVKVGLHQTIGIPFQDIGAAFAFGALMLPSITSIPQLYPLLPPAWSLLFEMIANAIYGFGIARFRAAALTISLISAAGLWMARDPVIGLEMGGSWLEWNVALLRMCFSFFAGVALYEYVLRGHRPVQSWYAMGPIMAAAALLFVPAGSLSNGTADWLVIVIIVPLVVWAGAWWNAPTFAHKPFVWLSQISYPLYTVHFPLIFVATYLGPKLGLPKPIWVSLLIIGLLILATLLARHFDGPARKKLSAILAKPQSALPA
jgi:peptidoglycan/LPS O-acetylase OafA/YrhL